MERVFSSVRAARGAGQVVWHSGFAGSLLGARFLISPGSSGSRAGGLALGFGRFVAWSAFFHQSGQLGEQDRWAGSRFWQVRWLERVFSSVRAARGAGQVYSDAVWAALELGASVRSSDPEAEVGRGPHPHPKLGIEVSQASRCMCVCMCVCR